MKKRRILIIGLSLALLIVMLVPSAAMAKTYNWQTPVYTDFGGGGGIYVYYMPVALTQGNISSFTGEIVLGTFGDSSWDPLDGAAFWSSHDSIVRIDDDGTTFGWMWGDFTLTSPDGSVMQGTFTGKVTGNLAPPLPYVSDTGSWRMTSGTGVFADVSAFGSWSADLVWTQITDTDFTLAGPINWQGKYSGDSTKFTRPYRNSYNWSPVKYWRPYTPGMFSWFRRY